MARLLDTRGRPSLDQTGFFRKHDRRALVAATAGAFNPANGFDWSEQPAAWVQPPWFQPDTEAWTPLPNLTVAPTGQQAPLWLEQPGQEAPVIRFWYSPEEAHAPPIVLAILPLDPSLTGDLWHDHSHQQARSIAPTWFAPDASVEGLVPPTAAVFDPATGFPWLEQPQDWSDGTPFVQREASIGGSPPLPNAYSGFDLHEQPAAWRDGTPWFRPDDANEIEPPLPNAATHPDLGWDATFDRAQTIVWFAPDASVESPLPLASPLTPLTPDLIAGLWPDQSGQQDASIQAVWNAPDASFEPPSFPILPAAPTVATVAQQATLWPEQPAAWQDWRNITDAIEAQAFTLDVNLYAPAPGATPKVLINAENGDVFLYIGGGFIVPAS